MTFGESPGETIFGKSRGISFTSDSLNCSTAMAAASAASAGVYDVTWARCF
jgi:hypothetical protein